MSVFYFHMQASVKKGGRNTRVQTVKGAIMGEKGVGASAEVLKQNRNGTKIYHLGKQQAAV